MNQSAGDALKALKAKIKKSIEETKVTERYAIGKENYAAAYELSIKIGERTDIIYTIDEMLDEFEEVKRHVHKWEENSRTLLYNCKCGAFLTRGQALEYLNKWQEESDRTQQMREIPKRPVPNVD